MFKSKWSKVLLIVLSTPILLVVAAIGFVYFRQDRIVQALLNEFNTTLNGEISIRESHIAPFASFPYISIDLQDAIFYADKSRTEEQEIVHLEDLYVGFNLIDIIQGKYDIKVIQLKKGHIDLKEDEEGNYNIVEALKLSDEESEESPLMQISLDKIDLDYVKVSLNKPHLNNTLTLDFNHIHSKFKTKGELMLIDLETQFLGSFVKEGKTTLLNKKHFSIDTELQYFTDIQKIVLDTSKFQFEHIELVAAGFVELEGEQNVDLTINGSQDNFNLLIAFAPEELIPTLRAYDNQGKITIDATMKGAMKDGQPAIDANFTCNSGYFTNQKNKKKLDNIEFSGTFTNGAKRDFSTMKFTMDKLNAQPEAGIFNAKLSVENFDEPDIDLNLKSNFNLDFLVKFLNIDDEISNAKGFVGLTMNFHDIIDLTHPEKSLEKLNESYFTELIVKDLSFSAKSYPLPVSNVNIHADLEGNRLTIDQFKGVIGKSDINLTAEISDVPAIIHQRNTPIQTKFKVEANHVDISELTYDKKTKKSAFDEKVDNFKMEMAFNCDASALTFEKLPIGEFFLNTFTAKLHNYPHQINEVTAGLFIEDKDIKIKRFKGKLDESDFLFFGKLTDYQHFIKPTAKAQSKAELFFKSNQINLSNLLTYKGENYLPESIKNETFSDVKLKAKVGARFEGDKMTGTMLELSELGLTTSLHEKRFKDFSGKIFFRKETISIKNLKGNIGSSDFDLSFNYFLGKNDSLRRKQNEVILRSNNLNLNEILAIKYNPQVGENVVVESSAAEEAPFSITSIPFMDFLLDCDVNHFEYLDYKMDRIKGNIQMTKTGTIDFKRCGFDMAGGKLRLSGMLDARDTNHIVFTPRLWIKNLVLDQTLAKFQNFGQDYILSENLSGLLNAKVKGTVPLNKDLTPIMEKTDLTLDIQILNGELRKYKPLQEFASFFGDKNLNRIKFDTLDNVFILKNNTISIPWMTINSSIGFIEMAGEQAMNDAMDMEYYLKIPLKLVTNVAAQKLFKKKRDDIDPEQEDEIQYRGDKKVHYINIKMIGNIDDFSISLGKDKRGRKS